VRSAFIVSFVANLILAIVSTQVLPERVAIHFGAGGAANGWGSTNANALLMAGVNLLLFCSIYFSPWLIERIPARWISLPNRDYWLTPKNKERAVKIMQEMMWQFGTVLFLFLFFTGLLTISANLSQPVRLNEGLFLSGLIAFLVYTGYWTIALLRAFRIAARR
jgi:hypothetical protein